jgi:hypothetical protein
VTAARAAVVAAVVLVVTTAFARAAAAQDTVNVTVPAGVEFYVTDVSRETAGAPAPTRISFSAPNLGQGKVLRLSLQADASTFVPPGGSPIQASLVSWTVSGASNGFAWPGTLSSSSYAVLFQSDQGASTAYADVAWLLAPLGPGVRAGIHQLTIRWKIESITP